jgi:hypothetical protein
MLVIFIAIITAAIFVYLYSTKKGKKIPFQNVPEDELEILELTIMEKEGNVLTSRAVSSITLYNGDITSKFSLSEQVFDILKANPWLAGRLVRHQFPGRKKKEIVLKYPRAFPDNKLNDHYYEKWISSAEFNEKLSLDRISEIVNPFLSKAGIDSIDNDEILFKIIILKIYDAASDSLSNRKVIQTALVYTLSHIIGDGHTFYRLYAFLDGRVPIESLIVKRDVTFPVCVNNERGEFYQKLMKSWKLKAAIIIRRLFLCKPISAKVFLVKQDALNEKKKEYLSSAPTVSSTSTVKIASSLGSHREKVNIVSSNDILTSLFFNKMSVAYGVMAVNFLSRKEEYTNDHAGNYEATIIYGREDYQSPHGIRQALLNNYSAPRTTFPDSVKAFCNFAPTLITNWSSFYVHLKFPGTNSHVYHLPLMFTTYAVSDLCVIFKKDQDQLAMIPFIQDRDILRNFGESFLEEDSVLSPQF